MSNYKKPTQVPVDSDIRSFRNEVIQTGGILRTNTEVEIPDESELVAVSGSLQSQINDIEESKPSNIWYVDGINGNDETSLLGSFEHPYKTVSAALSGIDDDALQNIFILAMDSNAPTEQVLITQQDLTIQGIGNVYSYAFTWNAHITMSGACRVKFKDLNIHGTISGAPTIEDIASSGVHNLDNVTITHDIDHAVGYISYSGVHDSGAVLTNCSMLRVSLEAGSPQGGDNNYNFNECQIGSVTVNSGTFTRFNNSQYAGPFTHNGGGLILTSIQTILSVGGGGTPCVISTPDDGIVVLSNCGLTQTDGMYGIIDKTGGCPYVIVQCSRDPAQDILNGFRAFSVGLYDYLGSYNPTNYGAGNGFIPEHLYGIDLELGIRARLVAIPSSSGAAGRTGDYAVDSDFAYFCIAQNTWVRQPVAAW